MTVQTGFSHDLTITVAPEQLASSIDRHIPVPVLATPVLIKLMEETSHLAISPGLAPGESSVGTLIHIKHLAATPVGMRVHIYAEVTEVIGRKVCLRVDAWDEIEKIGECEHERAIIDLAKFLARVEKKAAAIPRKN
jgi:fluoroacetyl-CoA thioesterase